MSDTPDTEASLFSTLVGHRRAIGVTRLGYRPTGMDLGNGGRTLFVSYAGLVPSVEAITPGSTSPPRTVAHRFFDGIAASPASDDVALATGPLVIIDSHGRVQQQVSRTDLGGWAIGSAFSGDGRLVYAATVGSLAAMAVVDADSGRVLSRYPLFRAHGRVLAAFSDDGSRATIWETSNGRTAQHAVVVDLGSGAVTSVDLDHRDGHASTLTALPDGAAQMWDDGEVTLYGADGHRTQVLQADTAQVHDVFVAPDGTWAATGGDDDLVVVWTVDPSTGEWSVRETLTGHTGGIVGIEFDAATATLLTAAKDSGLISWDLSPDAGFGSTYPGLHGRWVSNRPQLIGDSGVMVEPTRPLHGLSDDAALNSPNAVGVDATFVDVNSGRVLDQVPVGATGAGFTFGSSVSVDPTATWVAATSGFAVTILDADTHKIVGRVSLPPSGEGAAEMVWGTGWTRDGSRLLVGAEGRPDRTADGAIVVVDTNGWVVQKTIPFPGAPQTFTASPSGRLLAVSSEQASQVRIINPDTLKTEHVLHLGGDDQAYDMAFSPNEHWLAVGGSAGVVQVFDTSTWEAAIAPVAVHDQLIRQVEWMPDSRTVVTASSDGTISTYDINQGVRGINLPAAADQSDVFAQLVPRPASAIIALAGGQAGREYPIDVRAWLVGACAVAGRDLTRAEWSLYLPQRPYESTCGNLASHG